MQLRVMIGAVLYVFAVAAPVAGLYVVYGPTAPVDSGSAGDMAALAGATAAAFVLGLGASKVAHQTSSPSMLDGLAAVLREFHAARGKRESLARSIR